MYIITSAACSFIFTNVTFKCLQKLLLEIKLSENYAKTVRVVVVMYNFLIICPGGSHRIVVDIVLNRIQDTYNM